MFFFIFLVILLAVLWLFLSINPLISSDSSHTENSVNLGSSKHTCSIRPRISKKEIKFLDKIVLGYYFSALSLVSESREWKCWLKAQHSENEDHGIWSHHFMGNRWGNWKQCQTLFLRGRALQNHCRWWLQPWNWKTLTPWKESYDQPR